MAVTLGHELELVSQVGRGTIFRLYVPMREPEPVRTAPASVGKRSTGRAGLNGMRVLLLENDADVAEAMMRLVRAWGCEPVPARSSTEAL